MIYKKEHFANCLFNPFEEIDIPIAEDCKFRGRLIRYIVALYDPKSPLIKGEPNLLTRKEVAAEIAGFKPKELLLLQLEEVFPAIHEYLRTYVKSMEWAYIASLEETIWEYIARLHQPISYDSKETDMMKAVTTKTKLAGDVNELIIMYKTEVSKFYSNDKELIQVTGKIKSFKPEDVAKSYVQ